MEVTSTLKPTDKLTTDQLEEIKRAESFPITYDEDCPELSDKMEKAFILAAKQRDRYKSIS